MSTGNIPASLVSLVFCTPMAHVLETETEVRSLFGVVLLRKENVQSNFMSVLPKASQSLKALVFHSPSPSSCWNQPSAVQTLQSMSTRVSQSQQHCSESTLWMHFSVYQLCFVLLGLVNITLVCFKVNSIDTFCLQPFKFVFLFLEMNQQRN